MKILLLILLLPLISFGQETIDEQVRYELLAKQYLLDHLDKYALSETAVHTAVVSDFYTNVNNGWKQLYLNQTHNSIKIHNALISMTLTEAGEIKHCVSKFIPQMSEQQASTLASLDATTALKKVEEKLGFQSPAKYHHSKSTQELKFSSEYALGDISARAKYFPQVNGAIKLSWEFYFQEKNSADSWLIFVDASDGTILSQKNMTVYCQNKNLSHSCTRDHHLTHSLNSDNSQVSTGTTAQYRALALPTENPLEGSFELICDPAYLPASPLGWHDVDGLPGADHTITRGNNVWAYEDSSGANNSIDNEPDGGTELRFDFPFDSEGSVFQNAEADVTNLFYVCNRMHDLLYQLGFDSQSGAYQLNNYGAAGVAGDFVIAETLDGLDNNNANFSLGPDGISGRMQMYRWLISRALRIVSPADLAGDLISSQAEWTNTPDYDTLNIQAEFAVGIDANPNDILATEGCGPLITDVTGKIALIRRGTCEFGQKALNAQNAGAVAAIICNVPGVDGSGEEVIDMSEGNIGGLITIPVLSIGHSACNEIIMALEEQTVIGELKVVDNGPAELSGGFDNTIITHEYAHGLSTRLIGGPANFACLTSDEQMGEGISDFFALAATARMGDKGSDMRGIANYVVGQEAVDRGFRRFPYSTDMAICPLTLDDIKGTSLSTDPANGIHEVGEVWAAVLWDLYWAFSDTYGWTDDWTDVTKGNVQAMRLIIDGMKMSPCNPTFEEMRDAILAADDNNNLCLIWEVFARRGMGHLMESNTTEDRDDNLANFDPLPSCIQTLKISHTLPSLITPGDALSAFITVTNHNTFTAENVSVTEILPAGLELVTNSLSLAHSIIGDTLFISLGDMLSQEERRIEFQLTSDPNLRSITRFYNSTDTNEEQAQWFVPASNPIAPNPWQATEIAAQSLPYAWFSNEVDARSDQQLIYEGLELSGNRPVIRYWHKIDCTPVENGGFVEFSSDGGLTWSQVEDRFVLGAYNNPITFPNVSIANLRGYSGRQDAFEPAYLDFSDFRDRTIDLRFRFATYDFRPFFSENFSEEDGWYVDDLEIMDLKTYSLNAYVSADNADTIYAVEQLIIIDSDQLVDDTSTEDEKSFSFNFKLSPNPTSGLVHIQVDSGINDTLSAAVYSTQGRLVRQIDNLGIGSGGYKIDLTGLASGMYILQFQYGNKKGSAKVILL